MITRRARKEDLDKIIQLSIETAEFIVNEKITFYEYSELEYWISDQVNNILLVSVNSKSDIIGFLFCKIMSPHWALLDNFYVTCNSRNRIIAKNMFMELEDILKCSHIQYLSVLIKEHHSRTMEICKMMDFEQRAKYFWFDKFLNYV